MRLLFASGIAATLGCTPVAPQPSIVGIWYAEAVVTSGQKSVVSGPEVRAVFTAGGRYEITVGSRETRNVAPFVGAYTVDRAADPPAIDLTPVTAGPRLGIWRVEGDALWLCYHMGGGPRPNVFESTDGSGVVLYKFRRE